MTQTFSPDVARQAAQMIAADHTLGRVARAARDVDWLFEALTEGRL